MISDEQRHQSDQHLLVRLIKRVLPLDQTPGGSPQGSRAHTRIHIMDTDTDFYCRVETTATSLAAESEEKNTKEVEVQLH